MSTSSGITAMPAPKERYFMEERDGPYDPMICIDQKTMKPVFSVWLDDSPEHDFNSGQRMAFKWLMEKLNADPMPDTILHHMRNVKFR